jgi:rRNA pseudouridine-1189 N-methylase Emg1 (Nep1/Mra1 family)
MLIKLLTASIYKNTDQNNLFKINRLIYYPTEYDHFRPVMVGVIVCISAHYFLYMLIFAAQL